MSDDGVRRISPREAFENVRKQVGICGIWCGSCAIGNGTLQDSAIRLVWLVKGHGVDEWGPKEIPPELYLRGLNDIGSIPICPGCARGGGRSACEIRTCASTKRVPGCNHCASMMRDCPNHNLLEHMREGAIRAGLMVETETHGREGRLAEWNEMLRRRYPSVLIFVEDEPPR